MKPSFARLTLMVACAVATGISATAYAETATERFDRTVDVPAGVEIDLVNTNGGIEVTTWGHDRVEIVAEKRVRTRGGTSTREALDSIEIHIEETDGKLAIETRLPSSAEGVMSWVLGRHVDASVSYELRIPATARLDVRTVNGSVHSDGPIHQQSLRSTNGRINVEAAAGTVRASTTNGSIDVEVLEVVTTPDIEASTTNGSITLHIPPQVQARLEARTVNGSVHIDFPVSLVGTYSKRRIDADLNGGGDARIGLRTINGSIRIREY